MTRRSLTCNSANFCFLTNAAKISEISSSGSFSPRDEIHRLKIQANRIPTQTTPGSPSNRWLYKGWITRCHPTFTAASCSCWAEVRLEAGWGSGTRDRIVTHYCSVFAHTQSSASPAPAQVLISFLAPARPPPTVSTLGTSVTKRKVATLCDGGQEGGMRVHFNGKLIGNQR